MPPFFEAVVRQRTKHIDRWAIVEPSSRFVTTLAYASQEVLDNCIDFPLAKRTRHVGLLETIPARNADDLALQTEGIYNKKNMGRGGGDGGVTQMTKTHSATDQTVQVRYP